MSEENKALMRQFLDGVFNEKNLDLVDQMVDSTFVDHNPGPGQKPGVAGAKEFLGGYLSAFPDMHLHFDFIVAEGDMVVARLTIHGSNTGEMAGMPPTGKEVNFTVMDALGFSNGKIAERWGNVDEVAIMQQLGLFPSE